MEYVCCFLAIAVLLVLEYLLFVLDFKSKVRRYNQNPVVVNKIPEPSNLVGWCKLRKEFYAVREFVLLSLFSNSQPS